MSERVIEVASQKINPLITLRSEELAVVVTPGKGGDITSIRHRRTNREVLWRTPWTAQPPGQYLPDSDAVESWLQVFGGGWQLLLPNGGDACVHQGIRHVFHGEAALAPWQWAIEGETLVLSRAFFSLPILMTRRLTLDGDLLVIDETLRNIGIAPVELLWGHHPGFGGDLLAGPARLSCGARRVVADDRVDERGNALEPGGVFAWPLARDRRGQGLDLREPTVGRHSMAYLQDFSDGWAGLTRLDGAIGVALSWDVSVFPTAWLWQEIGASRSAPWFGRARVIGIEPCTSWPGHGLTTIAERTGTQLRLAAGEWRAATLRLHVCTGLSEIAGVHEGRAFGRPV